MAMKSLQATHEALLRTLPCFVACALGVTRYTTSKWKGPAHFLGRWVDEPQETVDDFENSIFRLWWEAIDLSSPRSINKSETYANKISKYSEVEQPNFSFLWWVNMFKFLLQELEQTQDLSSRAEFRTSMLWQRTFPWGAGWPLTPVGHANSHEIPETALYSDPTLPHHPRESCSYPLGSMSAECWGILSVQGDWKNIVHSCEVIWTQRSVSDCLAV